MSADRLFLFAAAALIAVGAAHVIGYFVGYEFFALTGTPREITQSAQEKAGGGSTGSFAVAGLMFWLSVLILRAKKGAAGTVSRVVLRVSATFFIAYGILFYVSIWQKYIQAGYDFFWYDFFAASILLLIGLSLGPALSKTRAATKPPS